MLLTHAIILFFLLCSTVLLGQTAEAEKQGPLSVQDSLPPVESLPASASVPPSPDSFPDLSHHTVVLSVDDGYHTVFTNIYPLLKQHKLTMTLALIVNNLGQGKPAYRSHSGFVNPSEVQEMMDSCNIEIASHSLTHPFLTRLDSARAWEEIYRSKVILESLFNTEVITFVYPYGDVNARIRRFTQKAGYKLGRAVRWGEPNLWLEPYNLPTYELRREIGLAEVKRHLARNRVTILLLHRIVPRPSVFTEWSVADFRALLDWLVATRIKVTTLRGLYKLWWYKKLEEFMKEVASAYADQRKSLLFKEVDIDATRTEHSR